MMKVCVIAAALLGFVGTASAGLCQSELVAAAKFSVVSTQACDALSAYEICVSKVADGALRDSLETELQKMQQEKPACVDMMQYKPRITVRDDKMQLEAGDFNFARTKRDVVNLYKLRDTVDGYQEKLDDAVDDMGTKLDDAIDDMGTKLENLKERDLAILKTNVSASFAAVNREIEFLKSDTGCIPYVEWATPDGTCKLLSVCRPVLQYIKVRATRTSDNVCGEPSKCADGKYVSIPASDFYDNVCATYTKCKAGTVTVAPMGAYSDVTCQAWTTCKRNEYETHKPNTTHDRECVQAGPNCPTNAIGKAYVLNSSGMPALADCFKGYKLKGPAGGDGSNKEKAALSCNTIRFLHNVRNDGKYWIYGNNPKAPFQVFCDMKSCGGDTFGWGDKSTCGGWTMVMQVASGSSCLNRAQNDRWKKNETFGDTSSRSNACGKSRAYFSSSFTDVMIQSSRTASKNVAWRHPRSSQHMAAVVQSCNVMDDGKLIVPGHNSPSDSQRQQAIRKLDWRSCPTCTQSGYHYHDLCYKDASVYKWGFFQRDSLSTGGQNSIVKCRSPWGHGGNVAGFGSGCGGDQGDCDRPYNSFSNGRYTYCVSAWGFGGGYGGHGTGGGINSESVNGHWWGHSARAQQTYQTALYVRDITEFEK